MTSIKVPPLGESIVEATVSQWLKNEGDAVASGDTLVELETDKITVEVPSVTAGVLKKRFANEGDVVKLDQLLAEVDEKVDGARPPAAVTPRPVEGQERQADGGQRKTDSAERMPDASPRAAPAAQRVAAETGTDISSVREQGSRGVISKADVIDAKAAPPPQRPPPDPQSPGRRRQPRPRPRSHAAPTPANARRAKRCRRVASASQSTCSSRSTRPRISRRSTRST